MVPAHHNQLISNLLVRWHRWSANPMMSTDYDMRQFDCLVAALRPCYRVALIVNARNLACGAAVWSSARVRSPTPKRWGKTLLGRARSALLSKLAPEQDRWFGQQLVTYNANGRRIGESNPRAKLTDHEVDLLRELREERKPDGAYRYSLGDLAERFKIPKSTVSDICSGRRRAQTPAEVREV